MQETKLVLWGNFKGLYSNLVENKANFLLNTLMQEKPPVTLRKGYKR